MRNCGNCRFYFEYDPEVRKGFGECRLNPPRGEGCWPQVNGKAHWCGKWEDVDIEPDDPKIVQLEKVLRNILECSKVYLSGVALHAGEVDSYCARVSKDFHNALREAHKVLAEKKERD